MECGKLGNESSKCAMENETHFLQTSKKVVFPILYLGQRWNSYDDYNEKGSISCQNFLMYLLGNYG